MKYTVEGFDQQTMVEMGLNGNHAYILRWFIDFLGTNKMLSVKNIAGEEYKWVKYQAIIDDLPIIRIKNREVVSRYLNDLVKAGLLEKYVKKDKKGTFTCYRPGNKYSLLIENRVKVSQDS